MAGLSAAAAGLSAAAAGAMLLPENSARSARTGWTSARRRSALPTLTARGLHAALFRSAFLVFAAGLFTFAVIGRARPARRADDDTVAGRA